MHDILKCGLRSTMHVMPWRHDCWLAGSKDVLHTHTHFLLLLLLFPVVCHWLPFCESGLVDQIAPLAAVTDQSGQM